MKIQGWGKMVIVTGICVVILALMHSFAAAEDKPSDNMQILTEKVKADKKLLVAENMQLTESEAKKFWPIYEEFQNELFVLRMRSLKLVENYGEHYESMTDELARKLLDEYMTIESLRQKVRKAYLPKFRKVLPETKVARYYQIENKISALVNYELAKQIPLLKTNQ